MRNEYDANQSMHDNAERMRSLSVARTRIIPRAKSSIVTRILRYIIGGR